MRSKQAPIYFIQSSQPTISGLVAEISIILFSQCEALHFVLFLSYSILLFCTFHPIFISAWRCCLCPFCAAYPLFIIPLCFIPSTGFVRTYPYFAGEIWLLSYPCDSSMVFPDYFTSYFDSSLNRNSLPANGLSDRKRLFYSKRTLLSGAVLMTLHR